MDPVTGNELWLSFALENALRKDKEIRGQPLPFPFFEPEGDDIKALVEEALTGKRKKYKREINN